MTRKILLAISLALTAVSAPVLAQSSKVIPLTLDASQTGPVINRDIFGQFAEHLGEGVYGGVWVGTDSPIPNVRGIRSDVVQALRALKVPNVRWPGGCYADAYDWRDGIGPASERKSHINMWGGVIDPNTFGTHEFMDFVEQIGSEAYVSVNVGSGTPKQAADWLEYMTSPLPTTLAKQRIANGREKPWRIKFLGLGNESWGCGGAMSGDHYAEEMKKFATFTNNYHPDQAFKWGETPVFPMQKIAVGEGPGDTKYTESVMRAWKNDRKPYGWNIDAFSLHYYSAAHGIMESPSQNFGEQEYADQLRATLKMDAMLVEHKVIMDKYDPEKKIALSIDEWGLWLKPQGKNFLFLRQQNSIRDAVAAALNFNIFVRHSDRVKIANIAQMVNVIQAMILTDGAKMLLTPTYHIHKMYIPFQDATVIPVKFDAGTYAFGGVTLPRVDAIAAKATDGSIWIALTNVDPNQPVEIDAGVQGFAAKSATGEVLTAPKVDTVNTFEAPNTVTPKPARFVAKDGKLKIMLPPKSVTVVRLGS
jgi:alpha-L-arabinofuranosidase